MVFRFLLRYLANNEKLIQMLADSYPMRKAARFTARMLLQAKHYQEEALKGMRKTKNELENSQNTSVTPGSLSQLWNEKLQQLKRAFEDQSKRR